MSTALQGNATTVHLRATDHWGNNATTTVSLDHAREQVPSLAGGPVADPDDDGIYEDVDASGTDDLFDALTYYNNRDSDVIQANPDIFDYDGNGTPGTLFDALALYNEINR